MMTQLSVKEVESGTGGMQVRGAQTATFTNVSIDTRTIAPGALFFAIRGPNQDGHRFIPDAFARGASGAVVAKDYEYPGEFPEGCVLIQVADTHEALKSLAHSVRLAWPGILVAVTGSMGKTTTREFAYQLMKSQFTAYQTPGNYNNLFGLPLALLGLSPQHEVGIFEMGMSEAGEIAEMCRIAVPTTGILTNVAPVHLQFFDSIEKIAEAKGELVEGLTADGTLIYNADDPLVCRLARRFSGHKISFGQSEASDIRAEKIELLDLYTTRFQLSCDGKTKTISLPFAGAHYVLNALPGIALCRNNNISLEKITESLRKLQPVAMRGRTLRFKKGFTLIDDSYNSNPRALMKMTEVLSGTPSFSRRILLAGEMLELGPDSPRLHFECGSFAVKHHTDIVIGVQGAAQEIVRAALEAGLPQEQTHFFSEADTAASFVNTLVQPGDLLLVKGSRGVHMEKIVKNLCANFETSDI
jgi:UDP-N-acetylmuramoyl-tripeptide--D-alanyl-D-alanine ligase